MNENTARILMIKMPFLENARVLNMSEEEAAELIEDGWYGNVFFVDITTDTV